LEIANKFGGKRQIASIESLDLVDACSGILGKAVDIYVTLTGLAEETSVIIFFDDQEEILDSVDFREWVISMPF
jgi:hypothetical protein